MPIYEFECEECGARFEELVAADAWPVPCPERETACADRIAQSGKRHAAGERP